MLHPNLRHSWTYLKHYWTATSPLERSRAWFPKPVSRMAFQQLNHWPDLYQFSKQGPSKTIHQLQWALRNTSWNQMWVLWPSFEGTKSATEPAASLQDFPANALGAFYCARVSPRYHGDPLAPTPQPATSKTLLALTCGQQIQSNSAKASKNKAVLVRPHSWWEGSRDECSLPPRCFPWHQPWPPVCCPAHLGKSCVVLDPESLNKIKIASINATSIRLVSRSINDFST